MPAAISHLNNLIFNPFLLSPILASFFRDVRPTKNNILLAYLVLPLVLPENTRRSLLASSARSSVRSITKDRSLIYGIDARVKQYKILTSLCIQHEIGQGRMSIDQDLAVAVTSDGEPGYAGPDKCDKAAQKLAFLVSPFEVPMIYRYFGATAP